MSVLDIKIKFVDTTLISINTLLESSFLSDRDISYLNKFSNEQTKKEKAYSLIFKNKYIDDYYVDKNGKPLSHSAYFSISHTHGVVVFVKDSCPIGIDIEKIKPVKQDLIDYISSDEEKQYIKDDISFFEVWTNKESLIKTIGTGINSDIKSITSFPIVGIKEYKNKKFYSRTIKYNDYIISVTREDLTPFDVSIVLEK